MDSKPTVYVLDDDAAARRSVSWLMESAGYDTRAYETAQEFIDDYDAGGPVCCLILDVRLAGTSGLDLLEQLPALGILIPVVMLTGFGDVPMAVRALKRGAVDFLEKPFNHQTLVDAVHRAIQRDAQTRREHAERIEIARRSARLTPREREVMSLVVAGKANKRTAAELGCSCKTVEVHRARVMEKMQADSVPALVRMAIALGDSKGKH